MKIEINNENKAKFLGVNLGCLASSYNGSLGRLVMVGTNSSIILGSKYPEEGNSTIFLSLKPLSLISDEDLEFILPIVQKTSYHGTLTNVRMARQVFKTYLNKESTIHGSHWWEIQDILRSRSYLLPWMGLSVDEIIDAGWAKYETI